MPEPGRGEKIPLGIESGSEDIHDVPRVFLAQYHEKDMERLHHKLRQKQEETHKREEKRREEVEKVRSILFKFYLEQGWAGCLAGYLALAGYRIYAEYWIYG